MQNGEPNDHYAEGGEYAADEGHWEDEHDGSHGPATVTYSPPDMAKAVSVTIASGFCLLAVGVIVVVAIVAMFGRKKRK